MDLGNFQAGYRVSSPSTPHLDFGNLTWLWLENGGPGLNEDVFPIENGVIPASHVSLLEGK